MIKSIKFKDSNPFNPTTKTITFGTTNVIIGPKGGGKSTLYDLLANLEGGKVFSSVVKALEKHSLEIVSYEIDNETYPFGNVNVLSTPKKIEKFKETFYANRNDVIYQDDPIKKNLGESAELDGKKMNFAKKIMGESQDVVDLVVLYRELYDCIHRVILQNSQTINWSNSLLMDDVAEKDEQIIFNLNYSSKEINLAIANLLNDFNRENSEITVMISNFKNKMNLMDRNREQNRLLSQEFREQSPQIIEAIIQKLETIKSLNAREVGRIKQTKRMINAFDRAYRQGVRNLKNQADKTNILADFKTKSLDHFTKMARLLKGARKAFDKITQCEITLKLAGRERTENFLEIVIDEPLEINTDIKFDLMKVVLYNAKNTKTLVENWILSSNNQRKDFNEEKLINHLVEKLVKEKIKILANGSDYDTLSLGQRSIYGIKYKLNNSQGQPIFLDQPEDNLDNHTIAREIVPMLREKREQVFIVTHNANIGLLTRPDVVIVAALQQDAHKQTVDQYLEGKIVREAEVESDAAHYLEGGTKYIMERLKIIGGE